MKQMYFCSVYPETAVSPLWIRFGDFLQTLHAIYYVLILPFM